MTNETENKNVSFEDLSEEAQCEFALDAFLKQYESYQFLFAKAESLADRTERGTISNLKLTDTHIEFTTEYNTSCGCHPEYESKYHSLPIELLRDPDAADKILAERRQKEEAEQAAKKAREEAAQLQAKQQAEEAERIQYLKLKTKYEGGKS